MSAWGRRWCGFSALDLAKALGGPLLKELFTPKSAGDLRVQFELKDRFPKAVRRPAQMRTLALRSRHGRRAALVEPGGVRRLPRHGERLAIDGGTAPAVRPLVDVLLRSNLPRPGATPPDEIATYIGNLSTAARH